MSDVLFAFVQVVLIDLVLAADNAIVIGMAAAGLPKEDRSKAIFWGVMAAMAMRIVFALMTYQLLKITGLLLVGGLLLFWVAWRLWDEIKALTHGEDIVDHSDEPVAKKKLSDAVVQIVIADVSMSLDNVLAVAGAARDHPKVMIFGLVFAIAVMGLAANYIAELIKKYPWIAYLGLAVIVYVAARMTYEGAHQLLPLING